MIWSTVIRTNRCNNSLALLPFRHNLNTSLLDHRLLNRAIIAHRELEVSMLTTMGDTVRLQPNNLHMHNRLLNPRKPCITSLLSLSLLSMRSLTSSLFSSLFSSQFSNISLRRRILSLLRPTGTDTIRLFQVAISRPHSHSNHLNILNILSSKDTLFNIQPSRPTTPSTRLCEVSRHLQVSISSHRSSSHLKASLDNHLTEVMEDTNSLRNRLLSYTHLHGDDLLHPSPVLLLIGVQAKSLTKANRFFSMVRSSHIPLSLHQC